MSEASDYAYYMGEGEYDDPPEPEREDEDEDLRLVEEQIREAQD